MTRDPIGTVREVPHQMFVTRKRSGEYNFSQTLCDETLSVDFDLK